MSEKPATTDQSKEVGQGENDRQLLLHHERHVHAGPLPPPEMLARYEEVYTGLAGRIVVMAEKEQKQRHINNRVFFRAFSRGQIFNFSLSVLGLGVTAFLFSQGAEWNSLGFFLVSILPAMISRFTRNKKEIPFFPPPDSPNGG